MPQTIDYRWNWYHFLLPSFIVHVLFALIIIFNIFGVDLHIFASKQDIIVQNINILPVQSYITVYTEPERHYDPPEPVDANDTFYDIPPEAEVQLPELHFYSPEATIESEHETTSADQSHTANAPQSESNIQTDNTNHDTPFASNEITNTAGTSSERHDGTATVSGIAAPVTHPSHHLPTPPPAPSAPDLEAKAWQAYTKTLSAHFKSHKYYPDMARRMQLTGTVWISVEIDRSGKITSVSIAESSGHAMLDQAALQSAKSASPVPPFPAQTTAPSKTVKIPYHYKLIN